MIYRSRNFKLLQNASEKPTESPELGFGTRPSTGHQRVMNPDGSFNYRRRGERRSLLVDAFHSLVTMSWIKFLVMLFLGFLTTNLIFAILYILIGTEHLAGVIAATSFERFAEAFFFSTQTLTTLGYGRISPTGSLASSIAAVESMLGLLSFALATGLLYGRFSHPDAKLLYSENAIVAPYRGGRGLMFRTVNGRRTQLIEAETMVTMARNETVEGKVMRKFYVLTLELKKINFLALSWTIVHPIEESSPFYGRTLNDINDDDTEVMVMIKAFDETYSQTVYSRTSYKAHQFIWGAKFISMMSTGNDGVTTLDLSKLNDFEPADLPA
jgi:inward rectifier potassium channel